MTTTRLIQLAKALAGLALAFALTALAAPRTGTSLLERIF